MITVLTSQTRNSLVQSLLNPGSVHAMSTPYYIQWGTGSGIASGTDETLFNPVQDRVAASAGQVTTTTSGDTLLISGTITSTGTQSITNVGVFTTQSSTALGSLVAQLNPGVTTLLISGYPNFPSTFPFDVQIGAEVMTVTSGNGTNSWAVTRNTNGSPRTATVIPALSQIVGGIGTANGTMLCKTSFDQGIVLNSGDSLIFKISVQFI